MSASAALSAGVSALGIALPSGAEEKLLAYLALLDKWNRVYNLTAVRERERMVPQHLLDSLAVVAHLRGATVLDVGSGAGLPGIPIALARPELAVTLLEANHKKCAFLRQALIELSLSNVNVECARVEDWAAPQRYDMVIARAFSDLRELVTLAGGHLAPGGTLAAMKGVHPYEELDQLPAAYRVASVIALAVPGLDAQRHLVLIERESCVTSSNSALPTVT